MWVPSADMVDHIGKPVAEDDDFFVPPPPEIGDVISASTVLKESAEPTAVTPRRIWMTLVTGAVIFAFIWLLSLANWKPDQIRPFWEVSSSVLYTAMLISWLALKPRYTCSYVCTHGVARFACYGSRSRITLSEIFRFETATSMKKSLRNIYVNGSYLNTEYNYRWFDSTGNQCYRLAGVYRGSSHRITPDDRYFVARVAEARWTEYLLPTALSSIESGSALRFSAGRKYYIEIGPEYVEFRGKRVRYEDLDLRVEHGFIVFRRQGETRVWYKFDRVPRVRYAELENAFLAVCLVEHITDEYVATLQTASDARYHLLHFA